MDAEAVVASFHTSDRFLRRVRFPDQLKRGILSWRAFKDKGETLSWTLQDETLRTNAAIDDYREYWSRRIGDGTRPGVFWLSYLALTQRVQPALEPWRAPDDSDPQYGRLHCATQIPQKDQMDILAKIVNDGEEGAILRIATRLPSAPA